MRISTALLATAAVAIAAVPGHANAEAAYATDTVTVHAGPGPDYPVVGTLAADEDVQIQACLEGRTWCDISAPAGRGWVSGDYLAYVSDGTIVASTATELPTTTYQAGQYWDSNYRDRDFYAQRDQYVDRDPVTPDTTVTTTTTTSDERKAGAALTGAASGAAVGALVGGPVGAVVGGAAGAMAGSAVQPPDTVTTYVVEHKVAPVTVDSRVEVGAGVPEQVTLHPVPDYEYQYAYLNGQPVLIDPSTREVVYVFR